MPEKKKAAKKGTAKKAAAKKPAAKKAPTKRVTAKKVAPVQSTPMPEEIPVKATPPVLQPQKMTAFIRKQQQKLLDLQDELMEALHGVQSEAIKAASMGGDNGSGEHQGDAGSDSYDRDLALSMLAKEKDALQEVEAALQRIDRGIYGLCAVSGKKIPTERLEILPFARLSIECQQALEADRLTRGLVPGDYGYGAFESSSRAVSLDGSDD